MSLRYRVHEWAAERLSWVQYPHIKPLGAKQESKLRFAHRMPLGQRLDLLLFSLAGLVLGAGLLFAIGLVAYAVLFG